MNTRNRPRLIKQEALLSAIEIQQRIILSFEKEVYENIGQVLSLVKLQLLTLNLRKIDESQMKINDSGKLIGNVIRDLRQLTSQSDSKKIIEKGFAAAIESELQRIKNINICDTDFSISGIIFRLTGKKELLAFNILQELILDRLSQKVNWLALKLRYQANVIVIEINYNRKDALRPLKHLINVPSRLDARLKLIGAVLTVYKAGDSESMQLVIKK